MSAIRNFRKFVLAAITVPVLATAFVTAAPLAGLDNSVAEAQQINSFAAYQPQQPTGRTTGGGGEGNNKFARPELPLCPPGAAAVPGQCRPWTPPRRKYSSLDDCECEFISKNGRKVRDCYVLIDEKVQYCTNDRSKKF